MQPLVKEHLRSVARGVVPGVLVVVIGVAASIGPWSPLALGWADALASRGADEYAAAAYRSVAHMGITEEIRERAAYRVAMATAVEQNDPQEAIRALTAYARQYSQGEGRGQALARLADLYMIHLQAPERAAKAWRAAVESTPDSSEAPDWLMRAALALEGEGKYRQASELRDQVARRYPERAAEAWLASARLLLERGKVDSAFEFYKQVAESTHAKELRDIGRLGMAICLENDGDLGGAVAQLEEASDSVPEKVWATRRARILERQQTQERYAENQKKAAAENR